MTKNCYFFSDGDLPSGFAIPAEFRAFVLADERPDVGSWWFLCDYPLHADFWIATLREQYPERQLVPFAKMEDTDDVACFDGTDLSESPKIVYVHAFASPGWEVRGYAPDFSAWLVESMVQ